MDISNIKLHSTRELMTKLRDITMLKNKDVKPYVNADISITSIHTNQLAPAQLYVLRDEFEKVRSLRWALLDNCNIDILQMASSSMPNDNGQVGYIEFSLSSKPDEVITVLPPIVEVSVEGDKSKVNIINDGMHRCFLARVSHIVPFVVLVDRVPTNLPYYAYPLAGGWNDVKMVEKLSASFMKKYHRFPNGEYQKYYRDFNSSFINVGGPRGK